MLTAVGREPWTIAGTVRRWAAETPEEPMLTGQGSDGKPATRTWREMDERTNRLANALAAEGVGAGDRIAFLDKNGLAYYEVLFGGAKLNAVDVAVNWRLAAPEMAQVINDAEARVLIVGPDFVEHAAAFADDIPTVRRVVAIESDLEDWIAGHPAVDPGIEAGGDDVACQLYTSGTTGLPKGVMLTNDNLGVMMPGFAAEMGIDRQSVNLAAMPLFHIGGSGWSLVGISAGCHTVLTREVDPALILATIEDLRVTHAFLVPAVLQFMLAVPGVDERDLTALRMMAYGASPISEDVLRRCLQTFGSRT
jgi:long-chain acyl-CoA synthetase